MKIAIAQLNYTIGDIDGNASKIIDSINKAKAQRADLVIFAGPSYFSKQPEQLLALYPKLKEAVACNPRLICSALVPAWYPESKGKATLEHALKTASEAGARSVPGVTLLTPRGDKKGASAEEVDKAAAEYAPQRIARYAYEIAGLFHSFYNKCRIMGVDGELAAARLALVGETAHVIRHSLGILGVSAPEKM